MLLCFALAVTASAALAASAAGRIHFDWALPDTYGSVLDANGLPEPTAPGEVRSGPWHVDLLVPGCDRSATYVWFVDGGRIDPRRVAACTFSSRAFPRLGGYTVEVRATVGGRQLEGRERITVDDWLIVSLGDSVASGEGVPEVSGFGRAKWEDKRCHRSAYAGPAVAARRLARVSPHVSVTFVHLACSGAQISAGLLGGYKGITGPPLPLLAPQVNVLDEIAARRKPSAVLVSIGANDVGFSTVVKSCASHPHRNSCFQGSLGGEVTAKLERLPKQYQELNGSLRALSSPVYLTEYFDPTGDVGGNACAGVLRLPVPGLRLFGLNHEDLQDARAKLLVPLNDALAKAAARYRWSEVTGIAEAFRRHGYCAGRERWITTLGDSMLQQGSFREPAASVDGTLHPNEQGQRQIAARIQAALEHGAQRTCAPSAAGATATVAASPSSPDPPRAACWVPQAADLPLLPVRRSAHGRAHGLATPWWILIALGAVALALLVVAVARRIGLAPRRGIRLAGLRPPRGSVMFHPLMKAGGWSTTNLVVVCLGAALVVFFAGVTAAVAAGQTVPTAMWSAGGAVSGALIGLLTPAPGTKRAHRAAAELAEKTANATEGDVRAKAQAAAADHNAAAVTTPETRAATILLLVVFIILLALGVLLAGGIAVPPPAFTESLKSVTTAVIALASASGSALIGILAPSQSKGG